MTNPSPGASHYTEAEFQALADRLSNWGRWGVDDEAGTLNFLTPPTLVRAASLVRDGVTVSCSLDLPTMPAVDTPRPTRHVVYRAPDTQMGAAGDFLTLEPHGWSMTHLDAFAHIYYRGQIYNGRPISDITSAGALHGTVMPAKQGIVSRGLLIDLPRALGRPYLDPGDVASVDDVQRALALGNVTPEPGDILLFRTGRFARNAAQGTPPIAAGLAGISVAAAELVHQWQASVLICDGGMDSQPSEVEGVRIPWHILTLTMMGLPIIDNADLERLADTCARLGRYEFMLAIAALPLPGGTSSPVNPIAMF